MAKERFAIWATNEKDERILVALKLDTTQFKVHLYSFGEKDITNEFSEKILNQWVNGEEVEFPESTVSKELDLSDDSLLPENIKVEGKTGAIRQLQNEWSYQLLTAKLWESFNLELDEIKTKAREISEYSQDLFDQCKSYWERALEYRKEKDLNQDRLDFIKEEINNVFDHLKFLRQNAAKERDELAEKLKTEINTALEAISKKLETSNVHFKTLIEELKGLQAQLKDANVRRDIKNNLYDEVQKYFEMVKEKRDKVLGGGTAGTAHKNKRLEGLQGAMEKIQKSLDMDKRDLEYNMKRLENSGVSKLEMQLREAKLKMIKDRVMSKEEKIKDIQKTYAQVEKEINDRLAKRNKNAEDKNNKEAEGTAPEALTTQHEEIHEEMTPEEAKLIAEAENIAEDVSKPE